jgi:hypothetical protein
MLTAEKKLSEEDLFRQLETHYSFNIEYDCMHFLSCRRSYVIKIAMEEAARCS